MFKNKLNGMGVALITPFKEDESVDYAALRSLDRKSVVEGKGVKISVVRQGCCWLKSTMRGVGNG